MQNLKDSSLTQIAIVVRDVEKTAAAYADLLGRPMPEIVRTGPLEKTRAEYKGEPLRAGAKIAFFHFGEVALELIEPFGDGPSTWHDHLERHGEGVHHIALRVEGMAAALAMLDAKGMPLVQKGEFSTGRYAYVDSAPRLGTTLELLEIDG